MPPSLAYNSIIILSLYRKRKVRTDFPQFFQEMRPGSRRTLRYDFQTVGRAYRQCRRNYHLDRARLIYCNCLRLHTRALGVLKEEARFCPVRFVRFDFKPRAVNGRIAS